MRRAVLFLASAALAAGCGEKKPPPRPAPAAAPAAEAAAPEKAGDKAAVQEWSHSSVGKRDPFRSFFEELEAGGPALATRCTTPLGRFEIEQLRLVAVITGLDDPVAMVEAPSGVGYAVRRGACIAKNGGVVAGVRSGGWWFPNGRSGQTAGTGPRPS